MDASFACAEVCTNNAVAYSHEASPNAYNLAMQHA
jgi:hypothetical protein